MRAGLAPYSYPKNLQTHCVFNKPYHFWGAAGLSWILVHKFNIQPKVAARVVFDSAIFYRIANEVIRFDQGFSGASFLERRRAYDPVHELIRIDLHYAAAGSIFGAYLGRADLDLHLDDVFLETLGLGTYNLPFRLVDPFRIGAFAKVFQVEAIINGFEASVARSKSPP